jgi:hypothetical protein
MGAQANWNLQGDYFESCTCDLVCPCIFLMPPTKGYCEALVAWHVKKGSMGSTKLDGLNVVVWLRSPKILTDGNWRLALYIDDRADEKQKDALANIYGGKVGGHPAVLAGFVSELLGVKSASIEFKEEGKKRHLVVKGIAENEMYAIDGEDGKEVKVSNHPLAVSPGHPVTVSKSKKVHYKDYGINWSLSETVGLSAPFSYKP